MRELPGHLVDERGVLGRATQVPGRAPAVAGLVVALRREFGDPAVAEFTAKCYHQACERWSATWDLSGAAQDVTLVYQMAGQLAYSRAWPQWNPGSEFKAVRDTSAAQRR